MCLCVLACMKKAVHKEAISVCCLICGQAPHENACMSMLELPKYANEGIKMVTGSEQM